MLFYFHYLINGFILLQQRITTMGKIIILNLDTIKNDNPQLKKYSRLLIGLQRIIFLFNWSFQSLFFQYWHINISHKNKYQEFDEERQQTVKYIQMKEQCKEHKMQIQIICLQKKCSSRGICLLCEHSHNQKLFKSIMSSTTIPYPTFVSKISSAIDTFFLAESFHSQNQLETKAKKIIDDSFAFFLKKIISSLQDKKKQFLHKIEQSQMAQLTFTLRSLRASKKYLSSQQKMFNVFLDILEGTQISESIKQSDQNKIQGVLKELSQFKEKLQTIFGEIYLKIPNLILKAEAPKQIQTIVPQKRNKKCTTAIETKVSKQQFDSIISDSYKTKQGTFLVLSYDKFLRQFSPSLELLSKIQFANIPTKLNLLSDDVYLLGISKELSVLRLTKVESQLQSSRLLTLKGHTQRIHSVCSLNSRIVLSGSSEGIKLWDLYTQRCEHTFKSKGNSASCLCILPQAKQIGVGWHSSTIRPKQQSSTHSFQLHSLQTLECIRKYSLEGYALTCQVMEGLVYVGGFPSTLSAFDLRQKQAVWSMDYGGDAVSCITACKSGLMGVGFRDGCCWEVDFNTKKATAKWNAHSPMHNNWSKPNGVVSIYQESFDEYITVGCNDRCLKVFQVQR